MKITKPEYIEESLLTDGDDVDFPYYLEIYYTYMNNRHRVVYWFNDKEYLKLVFGGWSTQGLYITKHSPTKFAYIPKHSINSFVSNVELM